MDDFNKLTSAIGLVPILHKLNDNKTIKIKTKYPVLKTKKRKFDTWWNSLNYYGKIDVGSIALHYHKITPNYKWKCNDEDKFSDLSNGQKKIVKFCWEKRKDNWYMFDIKGILKL